VRSRRLLAVRFTRYTIGSIVAFAISEVALVLCYGTGLLSTTPASVVAFFAGAIPNYALNRAWVWQRRGLPDLRRELLPYVLVSVVSLVGGAVATGWAEQIAPDDHAARIAFVAGAYLVAYGVLFVLKFVVYQLFIFADRPLPP